MADEKDVIEYDEANESNLIITLKALYNYILTTPEFETLSGKTQVLNAGVSNPELGLTTRMEHDIQVSQNAEKIAKKLGLSEHDIIMARIGGIAHDLGHTPFGHDGEDTLDESLKKFNERYEFRHEKYGAEILDRMIDRLYYQSKETDEVILPKGFNPAYLMLAKYELKRSVKHHTQYYGFQVTNESPVEQCVRLADTLSFMVTDLRDLLKGYTSNEQEEHIITKARLLKELNRIPGMNAKKLEIVVPELERLMNGENLEELQSALIDEAFSTKRVGEKPTTVIDDIKLERDIVTILRDIKFDNSRKSLFERRTKALNSIVTYYSYLSDKKGFAEPNQEFKNRIEELVGESNPEKCYEQLSKIASYMKDSSSVELTLEEQKIMHNMLGKEMEGLLDIVERHSNGLIERDLSAYPMLMTVFALHDKLQYDLILGRHPERLDNSTVTTKINGKEIVQSTKNAVQNRFERVLKMAYAVETDFENYTLSHKKPNLSFYDGKIVPSFGLIVSKPLRYATFAVQQMQNKDFEDEKILSKIALELNVNPKMLPEIMDIPIEEIRFNTPKLVTSPELLSSRRTVIKGTVDSKGRFKYVPERKSILRIDAFTKYSAERQKEVLDFITHATDRRLQLRKEENNDNEER